MVKTYCRGRPQDYFISTIGLGANNFELKPTLINMMQNSSQFIGLLTEELLAHLKKFFHFADTIKINVPTNVIQLRLFPFSLANKVLKIPRRSLVEIPGNASQVPHHNFPRGQLIQIFYRRRTIRKKSPNEAYSIIEEMASTTYHYSSCDRHVTRRLAEKKDRHSHQADQVSNADTHPTLANPSSQL
ncbi:hypothetical protein CR513_07931, partial [Mucuna pruriens]